MRIESMSRTHLTYCTGIHPAETLDQIYSYIGTFVLAVKYRVCPDRPFGVGLRLGAEAASELACPRALCEFRRFLEERGLYVFTVDARTPGRDDGRPGWTSPKRLEYADRVALVLAALLPSGVPGTATTAAGPAPAAGRRRAALPLMARRLLEHTAILDRVRDVTGKDICLALGSDPSGALETTGEVVEFFESHVLSRASVRAYARLTGLRGGRAEASLRRHLGVCLDACHLALQFERAERALDAFDGAGIRVAKVQLGAGLQIDWRGGRSRGAVELERLAQAGLVRQVVERRGQTLTRFGSLSQALRGLGEDEQARTWRVHFHAPLAQPRLGELAGTQAEAEELLRLIRQRADVHLEVRPSSWSAMPWTIRRGIVDTLCEDLQWVLTRLS